MNCECNNNSNRVKPRIKHVYGNVLRIAIPLTLRTLVKDGDEMIVNDTDFIPSSDHLVRVVFSKGKTNYPLIATMDGNVAIIEDKGKIPVGTYDISVECYDNLGNPYRFKQNAVLYVADTTAEAGIDTEIEYEAQTWYLDAAVFLATTEIGEIGDVIDAKLDDVFGDAVYDANAKEIRFYNKNNSRVLATIDSRPFIVDGMVADVYIDVSRQVLVVVLNEDAGGRRFSVPLYLVFNSYYKKDEVDRRIALAMTDAQLQFNQKLPLIVPVTQSGSTISSTMDFGVLNNAIREDGREVVACINNSRFYQLLGVNGDEIVFSNVNAVDGFQTLLAVHENNVWALEDVEIGTGGGGGTVTAVKMNNGTPIEPDENGVVNLGTVITAHQDISGKVDKNGTDSLMTAAEHTKLQNLPTADELSQQMETKANDNAVVKSISVNGGTAQTPTNGNVNIQVQTGSTISPATASPSMDGTASVGSSAKYAREDHVHPHDTSKLSKSDVSVETQGDGMVNINVKDDTYTINLNHTHEGMVKLEKYTEATLPQTLDDDIIYVQVDDVTNPQAIEALYIFGLEFTGGGAAPGTPAIYTTPGGSELNLGENDGSGVEGTITVKGRNLTGDLTVAVTANSGLSLSYGQTTGASVTIPQADAEAVSGAVVTVSYSGSGALDLADGLSISGGGASTKYMKVVVTEPAPIELDGVKLTGTQWAETDYYPNSKTEFVFELTFAANSNTEIVDSNVGRSILSCQANSSNGPYFNFYHVSTSAANDHRAYIIQMITEGDPNPPQNLFVPNAYTSTVPTQTAMNKMLTPHSILRYTVGSSTNHVAFEPGGVATTGDYESINVQKKNSAMTYPLNIGYRYSPSANLAYSKFDLTVHRLTIMEDGVVVRDYVPRIKGGVVGLLDIAQNGTGLFLTSETADEFEAVPLSSNS